MVCRLKTCTTLESSRAATSPGHCNAETLSFSARHVVLSGAQTQDLCDSREQWASYLTNALKPIRDSSVKAWSTSTVASQVDLVCRLKTLYDPRGQWASYLTNALQCTNTASRYGRLQNVCPSMPSSVEWYADPRLVRLWQWASYLTNALQCFFTAIKICVFLSTPRSVE